MEIRSGTGKARAEPGAGQGHQPHRRGTRKGRSMRVGHEERGEGETRDGEGKGGAHKGCAGGGGGGGKWDRERAGKGGRHIM